MGAAGPDLPKHLTDEERALYEQAQRTRRSIRDMLSSLDPHDARRRAVWRAADDEAAGIELVLEWEAFKRAKEREASAGHANKPGGEPGTDGD